MNAACPNPWHAYHFFYHSDQDVLLRQFLFPAVSRLVSERLIERFFFIRYTLGGPHVRFRFRLASSHPRALALADEILQNMAAEFVERRPSRAALDLEAIRHESRAILGAVPEDSALFYEDNSFLPFPFEPEVDRYGGVELLPCSLDFFAISSAQVLEILRSQEHEPDGRRWATALRLLWRQASGFAASEKELLSHLGYRLPLSREIGDAIWAKADHAFEKRRDQYRALLNHEVLLLGNGRSSVEEPAWPSAAFYVEAARSLSRATCEIDQEARWQIGHSHLHMTANRLGFFPHHEMYLQRILRRTVEDFSHWKPSMWQETVAALETKLCHFSEPRPLSQLLDVVLSSLVSSIGEAQGREPFVGRSRRTHETA